MRRHPILSRWDALAAQQLCAEVDRLRVELEVSEIQRQDAERERDHWIAVADAWRDDAFTAIREAGQRVGITTTGRITAA